MGTQIEARETSATEQQARAELAFKLDQRVKAGLQAGREAMWDVAAALREFSDKDGWAALGYDKLGDWLADPEVGMARTVYHRLIRTHRELSARGVSVEQMKELEMSKVDVVLPSVKSGKRSIEDALDDVKELGFRDLREQYVGPDEPKKPAVDADVVGAGAGTNPVDDVPVVASEPGHNPDLDTSGQDQRDPVPFVDASDDDVIETTAVVVEEAPILTDALAAGRAALLIPQRLPGSRQAVRGALTDLINAVEARHSELKSRRD